MNTQILTQNFVGAESIGTILALNCSAAGRLLRVKYMAVLRVNFPFRCLSISMPASRRTQGDFGLILDHLLILTLTLRFALS